MAEQTLAILGSSFCKVVDEGFDRFSAGVAEGWGSAVVGGIGLHEGGIELVLTDQQAETITQARLTVVVAVGSVRGRRTSDSIGQGRRT